MIGLVSDWYDRATLPKFRNPPVSETAMAIEFAPIPGFDFIKLLRLQDRWSVEYPKVSEVQGAPPSQMASEGPQTIEFQIFDGPKRIWAENPSTGGLVQTQSDRVVTNWRRLEPALTYPGYKALRAEFERVWSIYHDYVESESLAVPAPFLSEFTFVNVVPVEPEDTLADLVTLIREPDDEVPGRDTFGRFQFIRGIERSETHPFDVQIQINGGPMPPSEEGRRVNLSVVARVVLAERGNEPMAGLDAAHALASQTFARIITPAKRKAWELYE
jgi:uncharacterized protein (TIGR04255 family)